MDVLYHKKPNEHIVVDFKSVWDAWDFYKVDDVTGWKERSEIKCFTLKIWLVMKFSLLNLYFTNESLFYGLFPLWMITFLILVLTMIFLLLGDIIASQYSCVRSKSETCSNWVVGLSAGFYIVGSVFALLSLFLISFSFFFRLELHWKTKIRMNLLYHIIKCNEQMAYGCCADEKRIEAGILYAKTHYQSCQSIENLLKQKEVEKSDIQFLCFPVRTLPDKRRDALIKKYGIFEELPRLDFDIVKADRKNEDKRVDVEDPERVPVSEPIESLEMVDGKKELYDEENALA